MSNARTASEEWPAGERKWTVMVFMGAEADGNAPMVEAAHDDLAEMRAIGSGPNLNIFAQLHANGTAHRYHIGVDSEKGREVPPDEQDATDGRALVEFIRDSLNRPGYEHRPGRDYSMLVMWGHAYDFAIDHELTATGNNDALDFVRLGEVLKSFQLEMKRQYALQSHMPMPELPKLDIIAFDACDVATVELACELERYANYLLGSQIGVPIPGWPYDRVLDRLRCPQGRLMGPAELGSWTVRRYCSTYAPEHRTVSLSLLDLNRVPELFAHADVLATALDLALERGTETRDRIAALFSRALTAEFRPFVDVADLCLNLVRESSDDLVREAATALGDFLLAPGPEVVGHSNQGCGWPFIVDSARNAGGTAKLNGVSIYAPHVSLVDDFKALEEVYGEFKFARRTRWAALVNDLARSQQALV
jgi:hypothetical protein